MAAPEVMSLMTAMTPFSQSSIKDPEQILVKDPEQIFSIDDFNPEKHISFKAPSKVHTMADLNLADIGVSPVAVSEPFQLFTEEAVERMRAEVFSKNVWEKCQYSSNLAQCQLRGFAAK